jgi:glycosyltransferase involved in cell wall biosynthesis
MDEPLISIGMPVFNGERYISQALDALLLQDYQNFELIISDNASEDATQQICMEYAARDSRIRYYRNDENMGAVWNFNRVFELATGEYFMWACHDDYWEPQYISCCIEAFDKSPDVVLVGSAGKGIDPETKEVVYSGEIFSTINLSPTRRLKQYISLLNRAGQLGLLFLGIHKTSVLREVMPLDKILACDLLILQKLCLYGSFVTIPDSLIVKGWRGGSLSGYKGLANTLGIRNPLHYSFPHFSWQIHTQKTIFQSNRLRLINKISLSLWSLGEYLRSLLRRQTYKILLAFCPNTAKRIRNAWRKRMRNKRTPSTG